MTLFLTDFDQWYDDYEAAAQSQKYAMVKSVIAAEPIPVDYAEEVEIGAILIDVSEELINHNQVNDCLALISALQQQQPDLYRKEFQYLDDFRIKYHLFHNQIDAVRDDLACFQSNPVQGIDQLLAVLDDLQFYQATEPLVDLCRAVYQPISRSRELLGGTEIAFGAIVIFDWFERIHCQLRQGKYVDWDVFKTEAAQYDFDGNPDRWEEIKHNLTVDVESGGEFAQRFKHNLGSALRHLLLNFCRDMQTQHQLNFIVCRSIWESILECLDAQEPTKKQLAHPDGYFAINQKKLDRHLGQNVSGFLSMQQARGVAVVWGIPFLYEYLQAKQIISVQVAQQAIATAQSFKPKFIEIFQRCLWQFDFIHRWPRPASVSEADFIAEAAQFAANIEQATPLSDEPSEDPFSNVLHLTDKKMPSAADSSKSSQHQTTEKVEEPPLPTTSSWKPPKPRKSPLKEAKGLSKSKSKRTKPKKSGQGFS